MNWANSVSHEEFKAFISEEETAESVVITCDAVITLIEKMKNFLYYEKVEDELENLLDDFKFCKGLANVTIDFNSNFLDVLNACLSDFYDICDTQVNPYTKFCFLGL